MKIVRTGNLDGLPGGHTRDQRTDCVSKDCRDSTPPPSTSTPRNTPEKKPGEKPICPPRKPRGRPAGSGKRKSNSPTQTEPRAKETSRKLETNGPTFDDVFADGDTIPYSEELFRNGNGSRTESAASK